MSVFCYICTEFISMKREKITRVVIAWVLLLSLMPVFIMKSLHFHNDGGVMLYHHSPAGDLQSNCGGGSCAICHFFISPFVETESVHFTFITFLVSIFICSICSQLINRNVIAKRLRGPPSYSLF